MGVTSEDAPQAARCISQRGWWEKRVSSNAKGQYKKN